MGASSSVVSEEGREVVDPRCGGLDVHKRGPAGAPVACLSGPGADGQPHKEIRTCETVTDDLLPLVDWLAEQGVTHGAMEATGVSWKPVGNLLEGNDLTLRLVNARYIKAGPGRKTDGRDGEWGPEGTPDLLRHGLLRGSDVTDRPQRERRELPRDRPSLIHERRGEVNRLQNTVQGANLKLAAVASDVMGKSGPEILGALVEGGPIRKRWRSWRRDSSGRRFHSWSGRWPDGWERPNVS